MAAGSPLKDLREEATCSICLEFFRDPVMITECGHNFCRACLAQCWGEEADTDTFCCCPQCRQKVQQRSLRPNRQLANMVEIAQRLSLQLGKGAEGKGSVCERHQEPLKLFCPKDQILICVVCDRSKEHRDHEVIPLEEASQEYKDRICDRLEDLRKERENMMACKADTEKESHDLLKQTKSERQKTVAAFRQLREFLEEQEKLLLTQMEEVEEAIAKERDEHLAKLSKELSSLEGIIQEMEEKRQQPASEFLQDVGSTLRRCEQKEAFEVPVAFPPALKWKIWDFCDLNPFLEGIMKEFEDTLLSGLQLQKANVVLDPDTAHPNLILSEDWKSVREGPKCQDLPDNPERFDCYGVVLGLEGFAAGRHFWEVTAGSEGGWSVGVARESVRRKGDGGLNPEQGIWQMGKWKGCYRDEKGRPLPTLDAERRRIRVSLNCAGRRLAFFDADTAALICVSSEAPFFAETILPFFWVYRKGQLRLSP